MWRYFLVLLAVQARCQVQVITGFCEDTAKKAIFNEADCLDAAEGMGFTGTLPLDRRVDNSAHGCKVSAGVAFMNYGDQTTPCSASEICLCDDAVKITKCTVRGMCFHLPFESDLEEMVFAHPFYAKSHVATVPGPFDIIPNGVHGNAVRLSGVYAFASSIPANGAAAGGHGAVVEQTGKLTLSGWFRPTAPNTNTDNVGLIVNVKFPVTDPAPFGLFLSPKSVPFCTINDDTSSCSTPLTVAPLQQDKWQYLACVFDGTAGKLSLYYGDDVSLPSSQTVFVASCPTTYAPSTFPITLGAVFNPAGGAAYFTGDLDDIRIFENVAPNAGRIASIACCNDETHPLSLMMKGNGRCPVCSGSTATVTPTVTATLSATPSLSSSSTLTVSLTSSPTPSASLTLTASASVTITRQPTLTASASITITQQLSPTTSMTLTASRSSTMSSSLSLSSSVTVSETNVVTPTLSGSLSSTFTTSGTVVATPTATTTYTRTAPLSTTPSITLTETRALPATGTATLGTQTTTVSSTANTNNISTPTNTQPSIRTSSVSLSLSPTMTRWRTETDVINSQIFSSCIESVTSEEVTNGVLLCTVQCQGDTFRSDIASSNIKWEAGDNGKGFSWGVAQSLSFIQLTILNATAIEISIGPLEGFSAAADEEVFLVFDGNAMTSRIAPAGEARLSFVVKKQPLIPDPPTTAKVAAALGGITGSPNAGKLVLLGSLDCDDGGNGTVEDIMDWTMHPVGQKVGGSVHIGAIIFNFLLTTGFVLFHALVTLLYMYIRLPKSPESWLQACGTTRFPSLVFLPAAFLFQGNTFAAVQLIMKGKSVGHEMAGLLGVWVLLGFLGFIVYLCQRRFKAAYVPDQMPERYRLLYFALVGDAAWVSTSDYFVERWGELFDCWKPRFKVFMIVELGHIVPLTFFASRNLTSFKQCGANALIMALILLIYFCALTFPKPYICPIEAVLMSLEALLQCVAMFVLSLAFFSETVDHWGYNMASKLLVGAMWLMIIKTAYDVLRTIVEMSVGKNERLKEAYQKQTVEVDLDTEMAEYPSASPMPLHSAAPNTPLIAQSDYRSTTEDEERITNENENESFLLLPIASDPLAPTTSPGAVERARLSGDWANIAYEAQKFHTQRPSAQQGF